jgi:hypothetical protein
MRIDDTPSASAGATKKSDKPALLAIPSLTAEGLTLDEMRILRAYRRFDNDSQGFWLRSMESCAKQPGCGLRPIKPDLRLVAGGGA